MTTPADGLDSRTAWTTACAALAVLTIAHGGPFITAVALKNIAADLGTTRGAPAGASSLTYLGAAVGGIAAGWLSGRLGIRIIVVFGGVMIAAGLAISSLGGVTSLYVGHGIFLGLLGASCMLSPLMTYVSLWFERRRGAAVALISSGQSIAGALWPLIFATGIERYGWRITMQAFGVFALVVVPLLAILFLRRPPASQPASAGKAGASGSATVLGLPPTVVMAALMAAVFLCCFPMSMPLQHVVAYCGDIGITSQRGAAMLSVLLGAAFLARQFWGWVADRIGGLKTLLCSSIAQGTALSCLLLTQDELALFVISAAFGFGLAGLLPAYVIAIREHFPASEANWRVPTVLFAGYAGMAAGGWGAGALYDYFGFYQPAFAFGLASNALNLALLVWLVGREAQWPLWRAERRLEQEAA